ncbi:MAG: alpha-L-fucosidase [Bacteroidales bacterium]|nr:alpha-L-fucosidase [Bacteroidales bacterium]
MNRSLPFIIALAFTVACSTGQDKDVDFQLPECPPIPETPTALPIASVTMGTLEEFPEEKLDIPVTPGPFKPTWESIEENYPGTPQWLRDAKVGIWVHYGPQASGESGDWYARRLYEEGGEAYNNHLKRFGHPSEVGYKDVLNAWNPTKLDPAKLTRLYKKAGARFLLIQGVHHDNYDLWNSRYQPWNSVNIGPHRDLLKEWSTASRKEGMRFGVTFHHEYTWWWWQTAFGADTTGSKAGIPYDGNLTLEDGKGKWWEGYDPRRLYGIDLREYKSVGSQIVPDDGIFYRHLAYARWYATQWALRIMDVTHHYDPDFIYTDGITQGPFCGDGTGAGYKCDAMPLVMADFYNRTLRDRGEVNTFSVVKFRNPTNGTVTTEEFTFPDDIKTSQPWIREAPVGDWFYAPGFVYDASSAIHFIIEAVTRDGNCALCVPIKADGSIDEEGENMLETVGEWMKVCGEGVHGSKAWKTLGEGSLDQDGHLIKLPGGGLGKVQAEFQYSHEDIRFTQGVDGAVYAFLMNPPEPGNTIRIKALGTGAGLIDGVRKVKLLGHKGKLVWKRDEDALEIICPESLPFQSAIVFRID